MVDLQNYTLEIAAEAKAAGLNKLGLMAIREARHNYKLIAELTGQIVRNESTETNIGITWEQFCVMVQTKKSVTTTNGHAAIEGGQ